MVEENGRVEGRNPDDAKFRGRVWGLGAARQGRVSPPFCASSSRMDRGSGTEWAESDGERGDRVARLSPFTSPLFRPPIGQVTAQLVVCQQPSQAKEKLMPRGRGARREEREK
ncbi:hypothetical protein WR25_03269 [Diploscapter pachys]|uniref:Uncharacterized protein n=1 Tax=Diploscapter pachys TaxID=2018661 RepID=A0A2A2JQQ9_9BILA|nr:hypothetical protein WR25_03269 [Diploscapter pachys]